jgi:hypothetical protein
METQQERVLAYFKHRKTVDNWAAFRYLNITRLGDVIHKLRNHGYKIDTKLVWSEHAKTHYAVYRYLGKV